MDEKGWSLTTCCLPCAWPRARSVSSVARPILFVRGWHVAPKSHRRLRRIVRAVRYVLLDRDTKFTANSGDASCRQRETGAVATEKSKLQRFWSSNPTSSSGRLKEEALAYIIPFSEAAVQGHLGILTSLSWRTTAPRTGSPNPATGAGSRPEDDVITCRERLGGLLKYYYRQAA